MPSPVTAPQCNDFGCANCIGSHQHPLHPAQITPRPYYSLSAGASPVTHRASPSTPLTSTYQTKFGSHLTVPPNHMGVLPTPPSQRVQMSNQLRSQSLAVDDQPNNGGRRHSFQRQSSFDVAGVATNSGTILEETSSSTSSDDDNKSYLSVKRASLKKRLNVNSGSSNNLMNQQDLDHPHTSRNPTSLRQSLLKAEDAENTSNSPEPPSKGRQTRVTSL